MKTTSDKERFEKLVADAREKGKVQETASGVPQEPAMEQDEEQRPLKRVVGNLGHPWDMWVDS